MVTKWITRPCKIGKRQPANTGDGVLCLHSSRAQVAGQRLRSTTLVVSVREKIKDGDRERDSIINTRHGS